MPLMDRLLRLFGRSEKGRKRSISALPQVGEADLVEEIIETEPEPIKPHHRRMTHRDKRLLPKPKPGLGHLLSGRPRKKRIAADEAGRLFSGSLRTKNREIHNLSADEEQLQRYGLPLWRDEAELARGLDLSVKELRHYTIHRPKDTCSHYVTFAIPKRRGGHRIIQAPKKRLKAIQRRLNDLLVSKLPVSEHAHGFRPNRSVRTNAEPHVKKAVIIKMDIADCFPSIHYGRVRGLLIALGYSYPVAATLALLMTEAPRQRVEAQGKIYFVPVDSRVCVQGAPTSPGLCNAIFLRLDRRLNGFAKKQGFVYTRYADDLTFSGDDPGKVKLFLHVVPKIVEDEGFRVNPEKTRVQRKGGRQRVTGVTVNEGIGLSRKERRKLRAAIHRFQQDGGAADAEEYQRLMGWLAYLKMLNPDQAVPLMKRLDTNNRLR